MKLNGFRRKEILSIGGAVLLFSVLCSAASGQEENLIVLSLEITADETTSVEDVRTRMSTKPGKTFSEKVLDSDVRRLYDRGYMCTEIERRVETGGIHLKIHVSSRAVIKEILFQGNSRLRERELSKDMELQTSHAAHIYRIRKEESRIESIYKKKGFHFVTVGSKLVTTTDGEVNLVFQVREGPRTRISKIVFEGNTAFTLKTLLRLARIRHHRWFHPSPYVWKKVEAAVEVLSRYYRSKGWLDAKVEAKTEFLRDNTQAVVTFTVSQGVRYDTGKVTVSGNKIFPMDVIQPKITLTEGKPFDVGKITKDIRKIESFYSAKGYMLTRVATKEMPRETEPVMDIEYRIQEGRKARIERIDITGNDKTKDEVIRRELRFLPGEVFDIRKIRNSKRSLQGMNLFESVQITFREGSQPDLADVDVEVTEKKTGQFMFGAGYSSYDKVIGFASLMQRNFDYRKRPHSWREFAEGKSFVGDGQLFKLSLRAGSERTEYGFDFLEPWIFNKPIGFGFGISSSQRSYSEYDTDTTAGYVSLGRRIGYDTRIHLKYKIRSVDLSDVDAGVLPSVGDELGKNVLSALELSGSIDKCDSRFFPTRGHKLNFGYEYTGGLLGGDLDFQKARIGCDWYNKLFETAGGKQHVLKLSAGVRWAWEFSGTNNVPIYERYYAGGIRTVRGYDARSLGPQMGDEAIGGNFRLLMNAEYVFPLYEDIVHGVVFYDTGEVWADSEDFQFGDLRKSVGVGMRLKTPVFPVEFYYGWALDEVPGEPSGRFHFALGYTF